MEFTLKDFEDIVSILEKNNAPKDLDMQLPCCDYSWLSDEEFIALCKQRNVTFVGGREQYEKMAARVKKLNIPLA